MASTDAVVGVHVALGTGSDLKVKAVQEAFAPVLPEFTVVPHKFPSGVPEQPVGVPQTLEGARYRAAQALERTPVTDQGVLAVGIENGMALASEVKAEVPGIAPLPALPFTGDAGADADGDARPELDLTPSDWVDLAAVVLLWRPPVASGDVREAVAWSDAIRMPAASVASCTTPRGTVGGDIMWSDLQDPHSVISRGAAPRRTYLAAALGRGAEFVRSVCVAEE